MPMPMTGSARSLASFSIAMCLAIGAGLSAQPRETPRSPKTGTSIVSAKLGMFANVDALVSPNTFVVMSDQTRDLPLLINLPPIFGGPVTLTATCCTNPQTGQPMSLPSPATVGITPYHPVFAASHLATATFTVNAFRLPTSAFLATIHVDNAAGTLHATGSILVNVVKVPVDDTLCSGTLTPGSGTAAEVLPFHNAISSVFMAKESTPAMTSFDIGAATKDELHGWRLRTDSGGSLAALMSTVVFKNDTHLEKRIVPFDTSSCTPSMPGTNFIVASGQSVTIPIFNPQTTTLVLQHIVCRAQFVGCWSWGYDDVAVFSAPPFWTLFGGRRVTIDWIARGADL